MMTAPAIPTFDWRDRETPYKFRDPGSSLKPHKWAIITTPWRLAALDKSSCTVPYILQYK